MGNGAKAQMRRDKQGQDKAAKGSQLKQNEAAKSIKCKTCFVTFLQTSSRGQLEQHAENKHSKTYDQCFA